MSTADDIKTQAPEADSLEAAKASPFVRAAKTDDAPAAEPAAENPYAGFMLVALGDVSVHTLGDFIEGRQTSVHTVILAPGESVPADQVPQYVIDEVEAGNTPRLVLVSAEEAEEYAERIAASLPVRSEGATMHYSEPEAGVLTEPGRVAIQSGGVGLVAA